MTKPKRPVNQHELELQAAIQEFGAERVLRAWLARYRQNKRQRSPEYRAGAAERLRQKKMEKDERIAKLEAELERIRQENESERERAA